MIKRIILGEMQVNCYIVCNENKCIVIDPGANGQKLARFLEENELSLEAILLTHGHFDHIGAVDYLYDKYHCSVYTHLETIEMMRDSHLNLSQMFGQPYVVKCPIEEIDHSFELIGYHFEWLLLEGHCQGSSMIYCKEQNALFSGDVLFAGSIGRYDFPTSSHLETKKTLETIKGFDFDAKLYPGHGEASTLEYEKNNNPFLRSY